MIENSDRHKKVSGVGSYGMFLMLFVAILAAGSASHAQSLQEWSLEARSSAVLAPEGNVPFWFHSNEYGLFDENSSQGILGLKAQKAIQEESIFDYGAGIEAVGRVSNKSDAFFNQLYVEVKADFLNLYAGKKQWRDGLFTSDLSLGSMIWSGNAPTMPKVMLYTPDFVSVPWTQDYVAVKGYLGHGWFGGNRFVEDTYLHEKAFYLRFLPQDYFINGYAGAIHNVQWGGTHPTIGRLPQGLDDFGRVFMGSAGEGDRSPGGEAINALGNTVGAYEAMLEFNFDALDIKAYRQFYIETSVSTRLRSPWDGQWGLQLDISDHSIGWIDQFVWEHVNTKKQNAKAGEEIGADGYYANFLYQDGWTYKDRILGLPLITMGDVGGRTQIIHNIILAHHFGLKGTIPLSFLDHPLSYQVMTTYSRNYGRTTPCSNDFCEEEGNYPLRTDRQDQFYNEIQLGYQLSERTRIWNKIGFDGGDLSNEFALFIGASYLLF